ncbi:hypothetical protein ACIRG5_42555 [Lentzea sp. NPDC102401]|uniref:hypothetical protein n=1 Tax=Lentzea sp. NPDC102401 TaxID=3364128 RepID=UPI0037FD82F3
MLTTKDLTLSGTIDAVADVPVTTARDTAIAEVIAMHDFAIDRDLLVPTVLTAAVEQLRQAVRLDAPLKAPVSLMNVRVLDRGTSINSITAVRTVTIPAVCPACGGPRGQELMELHSHIYGIGMTYDRWDNPCGHNDTYEAVLVEARRFNDLVRGA